MLNKLKKRGNIGMGAMIGGFVTLLVLVQLGVAFLPDIIANLTGSNWGGGIGQILIVTLGTIFVGLSFAFGILKAANFGGTIKGLNMK